MSSPISNSFQVQAFQLYSNKTKANQVFGSVSNACNPAKDDLRRLGEVHEVTINGKVYEAVILKVNEIKRLGINLEAVFATCPFKQTYQIKNGLLVDIDLYQQKALFKAIIDQNPCLKDRLGFFSLRGSEHVGKKLQADGVYSRYKIYWFWTGEEYKGEDQSKYDTAGLVKVVNLQINEGSRFCSRSLFDDYWDNHDPVAHDPNGVAVFGALKK